MAFQKAAEQLALARRDRARSLMRDDILAAARDIVKSHGLKGLSMRGLGRAVGVTAPTLYDYFDNKDAVLDGLFEEGVRLLICQFEQAVASNPPGLARLEALGAAYRNFARENGDLFSLIFGRIDAAYEPGERLREQAGGIFSILVQTVEEAMAQGVMSAGDPVEAAMAIWGMAHGCVMLELADMLTKCNMDQADAVYRRNFDHLFAGLGPRGQDPTNDA